MTKTKNLRKLMLSIGCVATLLVGSMSMCFAEDAETKVLMTVPETTIDFQVTEVVNMVGSQGSTNLEVDNLDIVNNSSVGVLNIDVMETVVEEDWSLMEQGTDWTTLAANSNVFGLVTVGGHDFAEGALTDAGVVEPLETMSTSFEGNTGLVTQAIEGTQVAKIIVTVSYLAA